MHHLVNRVGIRERIDENLSLLEHHRPYLESEHVLNIAYNVVCGGRPLDDIELRRNDLAYLDALGARAIPDPATSGDFCRRFGELDVWSLMEAINEARVGVWKRRDPVLTDQVARIDAEGSVVPTEAEIRLESEDVAEFKYKPAKTKRTYRMVVVRKNLGEERGQLQLCENVRYFFYVTNDVEMSKEEVVAGMAETLTRAEVQAMEAQVLARATVEGFRATYPEAIATGGSKLQNAQPLPRLQFIGHALEL